MKTVIGLLIALFLLVATTGIGLTAGFYIRGTLANSRNNMAVANGCPRPKDAKPSNTETPDTKTEVEHLITVTIVGAGDEFDGKRFGDQPLKWWQKKLTRQMRKIALDHWTYAPLEEAETVGDHLIIVTVRGTGEFDGFYFRDEPLEEWERELARSLIGLAEENGGGFTPPPDPEKSDEQR